MQTTKMTSQLIPVFNGTRHHKQYSANARDLMRELFRREKGGFYLITNRI